MLYRNEINVPEFQTWKKIFVGSKKYLQLFDLCYNTTLSEQLQTNPRDKQFRKKDIGKNLYTIFWYEWILNQINCDDLELWANLLEIRGDIDHTQVEGALYALANPDQMGALTMDKVSKLIALIDK